MSITPSPWRIEKTSYIDYRLFGCNGEDILCGQSDEGFISSKEDANLIAAAPDLLEACKVAKIWLQEYKLWVNGAPFGVQINNAIAKAEGRDAER